MLLRRVIDLVHIQNFKVNNQGFSMGSCVLMGMKSRVFCEHMVDGLIAMNIMKFRNSSLSSPNPVPCSVPWIFAEIKRTLDQESLWSAVNCNINECQVALDRNVPRTVFLSNLS